MGDILYRVKLYLLNDKRAWNDKGTGHITSFYSQAQEDKTITLLVHSEIDDSLLLKHLIASDIVYQKQQDTLILWTNKNGNDIALSFQERQGRDDIWNKICEFQGKDPNICIDEEIEEDYNDTEMNEYTYQENIPDDSLINNPHSSHNHINLDFNESITSYENMQNIEYNYQENKSIKALTNDNVDDEVNEKSSEYMVNIGGDNDYLYNSLNDFTGKRKDTPRKSKGETNQKKAKNDTHSFNFNYEEDFDNNDDKFSTLNDNLASNSYIQNSFSFFEKSNSSQILLNHDKDYFISDSHMGLNNALILPVCDINHLSEISNIISEHVGHGSIVGMMQANKRERLALAIENQNYVGKILELFRICEDLDHIEGLHHIYHILKNLFLLNRNAILELLLADDAIVDVIGCLEYDPIVSLEQEKVEYSLADNMLKSSLKKQDINNLVITQCETYSNTKNDMNKFIEANKDDVIVSSTIESESNKENTDISQNDYMKLVKDTQVPVATSISDTKNPDILINTIGIEDMVEKSVFTELKDTKNFMEMGVANLESMDCDKLSLSTTDTQNTQLLTKNILKLDASLSSLHEDTKEAQPVSIILSNYQKQNHREYILKDAKFKEAIHITNKELLRKIHQTYRVQYIQDVIFPQPSIFEENVLSSLTSFIFFNKLEIVNYIQEDDKLLVEVFNQLSSDIINIDQKRNLILFVKEFCLFSQTLQSQSKESFFKALMNKGILSVLESILPCDDEITRNAMIDILWFLVEFNPSNIREFVLKECYTNQDEDTYLLNVLIDQMICDPDPELGNAMQISLILKTIADPDNMTTTKSEKNEFLSFFYKHNMHILIAPLLANTTDMAPNKDDYRTAHLLSIIIEILSFYVSHHTFHSKNYFINKDLLRRALVLTKSKHHFLILCALRLMRNIINLKDDFYNRYIARGYLFKPIVDAFEKNGTRYNLLNSATLELFEYIYMEDLKTLLIHVVENYYDKYFAKITYSDVFKKLKTRCDQHTDASSNNFCRNGLPGNALSYNASSTIPRHNMSQPVTASPNSKIIRHRHISPSTSVTSSTSSSRIAPQDGVDEATDEEDDTTDEDIEEGPDEIIDEDVEDEEVERKREESWFDGDDNEEEENDISDANELGDIEKKNELETLKKDSLLSLTKISKPPQTFSSRVTLHLKITAKSEIQTTQNLAGQSLFKNSFSSIVETTTSNNPIFVSTPSSLPIVSFSLNNTSSKNSNSCIEIDSIISESNLPIKKSSIVGTNSKLTNRPPFVVNKTVLSKIVTSPIVTNIDDITNKTSLPSLVDYPDEDSEDEISD
ncbi:unnamed protein product [Gordionus sp. m RMFG-2023]|uniref:uncharacterized protein LOC135929317 isoform X2 n=1 Tax=Gordionus sp. m RMFG-2023 TaxID=3053472 RepID=UPI0030E0B302